MQQENEYKGPLTGLNVIDFGHYYAGPAAAMLLADQGANVVRVVKPGARELPEPQYRMVNRNKKLLTLNLKTEEGKAQALSLIEKADVLIENFRPGVMKRLGLDYTGVKDRNPGLIYLSLPGFASTDKERAHLQAWEGVMAAAAGVYTLTSPFRNRLKFPPVYTSVMNCSLYGAIHGPVAIMAALIAREQHGFGTLIEAPLTDLAMSGFGHEVTLIDQYAEVPEDQKPLVYSPQDSREVVEEKLERAPEMTMVGPSSKGYDCADGRQIWLYTQEYDKFIGRFVKALGIDKQLLSEGFVREGQWEFGLDNNIDAQAALSPERKRRLTQIIAEKLLTKTAAQWEEILQEAGVPAGLTRTRDEWLALEPLWKSGIFAAMDNGKSVLTVPGRLADVTGPGESLIGVDSFRDAENITFTEARQLFDSRPTGKAPQGKSPLQKKGELLQGLKVLDLANVAAGPIATNILTHYGAEVIKADPPYVIGAIVPMILITTGTNQGKRSILTDMTTAPGREIFERLVRWADVVHHNSVDTTAKRLGVTHAQLQRINPDVVSGQITAFGGTLRGGWETRLGFEPVISSACGMTTHYGSEKVPQWHGQGSNTDGYGGICFAFAELLGVYQKRKTGYAGEVRTSLTRAVNLMQLPSMISEHGGSNWGEPSGQFAVGPYWWDRMYACADRWIYVATPEDRAQTLARVVANRQTADAKVLEENFAEHDSHHWLSKLRAEGISCHLVCDAKDFLAKGARPVGRETVDEVATGSFEIVSVDDHVRVTNSAFTQLEPNWVRVGEDHSYRRPSAAPRLGENTVEILAELGYSEDEIAELIRIQVSHEFLPQLGGKEKFLFKPWEVEAEK